VRRLGKLLIAVCAGLLLTVGSLHEDVAAKGSKKSGRVSVKSGKDVDQTLRRMLRASHVRLPDRGLPHGDAKVELGRALFFDWELSGNRDVACATCHHPLFATGDALSLSIGVGGDGLGVGVPPVLPRILGAGRELIPRNAPELFNRGSVQWHSQFWDSRVEEARHGGFITPAGALLPAGLESVLAAQAMFPVTSRAEMRGNPGENELADLADADLQGIWDGLMARLLDIPAYVTLFADAYPGVAPEDLGFQHAANAMAAFESVAYTFLDSPFDQYLENDSNNNALADDAKRGALLFYGKAGCANCHSGSLLTDQQHHNIGIPPLGPGKGPESPLDFGRARETGRLKDIYAFRTPPLRNVALTGPWMHNGAYTTLPGAVQHHLDAEQALLNYDSSQLDPTLLGEVVDDPDVIRDIAKRLDGRIRKKVDLSEDDFADLMAFLSSLTSPSVANGALLLPEAFPRTVPSGLPVDGVAALP
jgi:cytochrome c peroxidase